MATYHNCSTGWLQNKAFRPFLILFGMIAIIGTILGIMYWHASATRNGIALLLVLYVGLRVFQSTRQLSKRVAKGTRTYRLGWVGEMIVGLQLRRLPYMFHVFYDVRLHEDAGNTDYVVVGPTGIFTIEVKNHSNHRVWSRWHGKERSQSKIEARTLHTDLAEHDIDVSWVTSILVRADLHWKQFEQQGSVTFVGLFALPKLLRGELGPQRTEPLSTDRVRQIVTTLDQLARCRTHATSA